MVFRKFWRLYRTVKTKGYKIAINICVHLHHFYWNISILVCFTWIFYAIYNGFIIWIFEILRFCTILEIIAYTEKYLQFDWLRGVQYWPYLYLVFNICTLWLINKKKNKTFEFRNGKIEMYSLKTNQSWIINKKLSVYIIN